MICYSHVCFLLLFVNLHINSVLVRAEKLEMEGKDACSQYIYYDVHAQPALDSEKKQLDELTQLLQKRELIETDPIDIIVEQPLSIVKLFDPKPRVTASLEENIKKSNLKLTQVKPAEIRCASLAALYLLQKEIDPNYIFPQLAFVNEYHQYVVEDVTFEELIKEYHFHKDRINPFLQFVYENETVLLDDLELFDKYFNDFLETLKKYNINTDVSILTYAQKLKNERAEKERKHLWSVISLLFGHLFDVYLFNRMYEGWQNNKKVMLIAGYMHALQVSQMLNKIGLRVSKYYSTGHNPFGGAIKPLPNNQLDLFSKDFCLWNSCVIC